MKSWIWFEYSMKCINYEKCHYEMKLWNVVTMKCINFEMNILRIEETRKVSLWNDAYEKSHYETRISPQIYSNRCK